jgi:hypothetical protein
MNTLDLRDKAYDNDATYYLTADQDLIHVTELTSYDQLTLRVLVNGFYPGSMQQWRDSIRKQALAI